MSSKPQHSSPSGPPAPKTASADDAPQNSGQGQPVQEDRRQYADRRSAFDTLPNARRRHGTDRRSGRERRCGVRFRYVAHNVPVSVYQPGGGVATFHVSTHDISTRGIGFSHGGYLYPGSPCELTLTMLNGQRVLVSGRIASCALIEKRRHQVSVCFDGYIDVTQFLQLDPDQTRRAKRELQALETASQAAAEAANMSLIGRALIVDDMQSDCALFAAWLHQLGMDVRQADDRETAMASLDSVEIDLIIMDVQLETDSGIALAHTIRANGFTGLVVAVADDDDPDLRAEALAVGCNSVLIKPFDAKTLWTTIRQLVLTSPTSIFNAEPVHSDLIDDPLMKPLIDSFVASLPDYSTRLREALQRKDIARLIKLCRQFRGTADNYGFAKITQTAQLALDTLADQTKDLEAVGKSVTQLISLLRRAVAS